MHRLTADNVGLGRYHLVKLGMRSWGVEVISDYGDWEVIIPEGDKVSSMFFEMTNDPLL